MAMSGVPSVRRVTNLYAVVMGIPGIVRLIGLYGSDHELGTGLSMPTRVPCLILDNGDVACVSCVNDGVLQRPGGQE